MPLLQQSDLKSRVNSQSSDAIYVDPLLDDTQIGTVTVDFRLGPDFLVSDLTRRPSIELQPSGIGRASVDSFFRVARRDVGDKFVLYPGQLVLASSLEYIGVPNDLFVDVITRSSYSRLGIHLNTTVQPGFRGVASLELLNQSNNPVELVVGARIVQLRFHKLGTHATYQSGSPNRKYLGHVRPNVSRAQDDHELERLVKL